MDRYKIGAGLARIGIRLAMDWHRIGSGLTLDWKIGTVLASDCHWICTGLAPDWNKIGNALTLDWHSIEIGIRLAFD